MMNEELTVRLEMCEEMVKQLSDDLMTSAVGGDQCTLLGMVYAAAATLRMARSVVGELSSEESTGQLAFDIAVCEAADLMFDDNGEPRR